MFNLEVTKSPAQINMSLKGGLECLLYLTAVGRPSGTSELAKALGMEQTRVNRLLGTLASLGFAERTSARKYIPGPAIHVLASMGLHGSGLLSSAIPHLRDLSEKINMPVALGVLWNRNVTYLYHGDNSASIEQAISKVSLYPAEFSSIGIMLLSLRSNKDVLKMYENYSVEISENLFEYSDYLQGKISEFDIEVLKKQLAGARKDSYAIAGGPEPSMAVPLGDPPFAGLAAAGKLDKWDKRELFEILKEKAALIAKDHKAALKNKV